MKNRFLAGVSIIIMMVTCSSCYGWMYSKHNKHQHYALFGCAGFKPGTQNQTNDNDGDVYPESPRWARSVTNGSDGSILYAVSQGNDCVYAAGYIVGDTPYKFGYTTITYGGFEGGTNAILIKYDSDGNAEWASSTVSGPGDSCFYSVAAGSDGVYVVGSIQGSGIYNFGNGISISGAYENGANMVLVKYTEYGAPLWALSVPKAADASVGYSIALGADSIYISGLCMGNSTFGFGNSVYVTPSSPDNNAIIVKYDRRGIVLWARSVVQGMNSSCYYAVATGCEGIYAAGYIDGNKTYDFGSDITVAGSNPYGNNIILVKYNSCGYPVWARSALCGNDDSAFLSVTTGSEGIYAAGALLGSGPYYFGNGISVNGAGNRFNALIVKYDTSGNARWGKSETAAPDDSMFLSVAGYGDCVYAAGYIAGNKQFNFGNSKVVSGPYESGANAVLVKYCTYDGRALVVKSVASGSQESLFNAVTANGIGVYAAGYITGSAPYDFGNSVVVSGPNVSGSNMVLVRY
ncbi:MAG: hypothetical protein JW807_17575 [Spirochaetes bacterium]|nr:hypothetical protein [Spirochaetota bacterium]